jgi:hypothetical protein
MGAESSPKIVIVDESPIRAAILEEGCALPAMPVERLLNTHKRHKSGHLPANAMGHKETSASFFFDHFDHFIEFVKRCIIPVKITLPEVPSKR